MMTEPLKPFTSFSPVKIFFGAGSFTKLEEVLKTLAGPVLLVSGQSAKNSGLIDRALNSARLSEHSSLWFGDVKPDPSVVCVQQIVDQILKFKVGSVVAIGGGSVLDAAKAACAVAAQGGDVVAFLTGHKKLDTAKIPLVAVPTTAGTGAELSQGAILNWDEKNIKTGLRGEAIMPTHALVDPELTLTLNTRQTQITGFDVLTHATETFISRKSTPLTELHGLRAVEAVARYLPRVLAEPKNIDFRSQMSFHSMMMGYNLANASTCLPHRLQYPLGVHTGSEHALGLAMLYPAWISITQSASEQKFSAWKQALCVGLDVDPNQYTVLSALRELMRRIDFAPKLSELGVSRELCLQMASEVGSGVENDPWWHKGANLADFYLRALED